MLKSITDELLRSCNIKAGQVVMIRKGVDAMQNKGIYLSLQILNNIRCLRSSSNTRLITPLEKDTFQHSAAILCNSLPSNITTSKDFKQYCRH